MIASAKMPRYDDRRAPLLINLRNELIALRKYAEVEQKERTNDG